MQIEDYNNHPLNQSFERLKKLIEEKEESLKRPENLELSELINTARKIKDYLDKTNCLLIHKNDLDVINNHLTLITNNFARFEGISNAVINTNIHSQLSNIYHIAFKYPNNDKTILNQSFNKIATTYKNDSEEFKQKLNDEFAKSKTEYDNFVKDVEKDKDYLNSIVGDIKDFTAKYTTQEKAKYYQEIAEENEIKANSFLKYTNISVFCAIGFVLLPILLPIIYNIIFNIVAGCTNNIDMNWANIFPNNTLDLNFGGALLKITYSVVAFFPVLFFARFEKIYRDRAFKFKDLKNAILSINPYLSDITINSSREYDDKEKFKLEMAKIFFTQIHSTRKDSDTDLLKKFEQISNILKGIR